MENARQGKGEHDGERSEQVESKTVSIDEIARQLETRSLSPKMVDKETRRACIRFYMMKRDYKSRTIAEILHLSMRVVQRYTKRVTEENTMSVDIYWQKNTIGEFLNKCRVQSERLTRLLYSEKLSVSEIIKITREQNRIEMNCIHALEKNGYLREDRGADDVNSSIKEDEDELQRLREALDSTDKVIKVIDKDLEKCEAFQGSPEEKVKLRDDIKRARDKYVGQNNSVDNMLWKFHRDEDKKKYKYADEKDY